VVGVLGRRARLPPSPKSKSQTHLPSVKVKKMSNSPASLSLQKYREGMFGKIEVWGTVLPPDLGLDYGLTPSDDAN